MSETLRLLQVEDSEGEAATIVQVLENAAYGVTWARVETGHELRVTLMLSHSRSPNSGFTRFLL